MLKSFLSKNNIIKLLIYCIGFQQFPIINIGGCFKIYELLGLLLTIRYRWNFKKILFSLSGFVFFVLSPIVSFCISIFRERPHTYYDLFPETVGSFKFDSFIYPLLQTIFMIANFAVIIHIINEKKLYLNFRDLQKTIVIVGSVIAGISLFNCCFIDLFNYIPTFLHNKHSYIFRSSGFSIEPSTYVLYQTWIVLFTFFSKEYFRKRTYNYLLALNLTSLILTFSSSIVALIGILCISIFTFRCKNSIRFKAICILSGFVCIFIYILFYSQYSDFLQYIFISKIENFFTVSNHTLDSGAYRSYTSRIGFAIFQDYPLFGVGVGNSVFFMQNYDAQMGIVSYGETLNPGSTPQNLFACVFAEQGLLGGSSLIIMLLSLYYKVWIFRNKHPLGKMFFIGCLFNISILMTCPIAYSMYLWVFMAFSIGFIINQNLIHNANSHRLPPVRK